MSLFGEKNEDATILQNRLMEDYGKKQLRHELAKEIYLKFIDEVFWEKRRTGDSTDRPWRLLACDAVAATDALMEALKGRF